MGSVLFSTIRWQLIVTAVAQGYWSRLNQLHWISEYERFSPILANYSDLGFLLSHTHISCRKITSYHIHRILWVLFFINVYMVVFLFNTVNYVFLLLCLFILIVWLYIFIVPAGNLRLPWLKVRPHRTRSAAADCGLCPLRNVTF